METKILLPLTPEEAKIVKILVDKELAVLVNSDTTTHSRVLSKNRIRELRDSLHSINLKLIIGESDSIEVDRNARFKRGV